MIVKNKHGNLFDIRPILKFSCPLGHDWYDDPEKFSVDDLICPQCEQDKTSRKILEDGTIINVDNDKLDLNDLLKDL